MSGSAHTPLAPSATLGSSALKTEALEAERFAPPAPVSAEEALAFVRSHLSRRPTGTGTTVLITVPAPARPPEALLSAAGDEASVLWAPATGPVFAGIGCVRRIEVSGDDRLQRLKRAAESLWPCFEVHCHPDARPPRPRLFGGLAFQDGWSGDEVWSAFGDGCFTLPRLVYRRDGDEADLTLAVAAGEAPEPAVEVLERTFHALEASSSWQPTAEMPAVIGVRPMPAKAWKTAIEAVREAIRDGHFAKVVAAGRAEVELSRPVETADVLARLAEQIRSTRFAFFRPGAVFLGATPERLVSRSGRAIATEALAGSIAAGPEQAARLLESRKDQSEHAIVVRHIVERLTELCSVLEWDNRPQVRELRNVLHLCTPIRGELRSDLPGQGHVLDLVEQLHPTPAVGGVPARDSIRWIVEHETAQRGWYSGPVGWFDAAGDGEFAVALRSCVLQPKRAFVYAGAGIVRDSDPHLEYLETELKQRAVLAALGVGR